MCDCGDVEAWKEGEACEIHQRGQDVDMEEVPLDCFRSALARIGPLHTPCFLFVVLYHC